MPRRAREVSKTGVYHVMMRGINRQCIFEEKQDYQHFLRILREVKELSSFTIYAYCLMPNHIHLLIRPEGEELEIAIKRLGCRYVHWFNKKYERVGHLFQDRYKSKVVEKDEYFLTVLRYIIQNPYKANLEKKVGEYRWSSYKEYVLGEMGLTDTAMAYCLVGGKDNLKQFIEQVNIDENAEEIEEAEKLTTGEVKELFFEVTGCTSVSGFRELPADKQREDIRRLINNNLSLRQVSNITGKSKSTVHRIVNEIKLI